MSACDVTSLILTTVNFTNFTSFNLTQPHRSVPKPPLLYYHQDDTLEYPLSPSFIIAFVYCLLHRVTCKGKDAHRCHYVRLCYLLVPSPSTWRACTSTYLLPPVIVTRLCAQGSVFRGPSFISPSSGHRLHITHDKIDGFIMHRRWRTEWLTEMTQTDWLASWVTG